MLNVLSRVNCRADRATAHHARIMPNIVAGHDDGQAAGVTGARLARGGRRLLLSRPRQRPARRAELRGRLKRTGCGTARRAIAPRRSHFCRSATGVRPCWHSTGRALPGTATRSASSRAPAVRASRRGQAPRWRGHALCSPPLACCCAASTSYRGRQYVLTTPVAGPGAAEGAHCARWARDYRSRVLQARAGSRPRTLAGRWRERDGGADGGPAVPAEIAKPGDHLGALKRGLSCR